MFLLQLLHCKMDLSLSWILMEWPTTTISLMASWLKVPPIISTLWSLHDNLLFSYPVHCNIWGCNCCLLKTAIFIYDLQQSRSGSILFVHELLEPKWYLFPYECSLSCLLCFLPHFYSFSLVMLWLFWQGSSHMWLCTIGTCLRSIRMHLEAGLVKRLCKVL